MLGPYHVNIESLQNITASEAAFWVSQVCILIHFSSQMDVLLNQIDLF